MSDRRRTYFNNNSIKFPLIVEYTKSGTYNIPSGATSASVFIVGGGGGGAGDGSTFRNCGGGGNGGVVKTFNSVSLGSSTKITVTIGAGGAGGSHYSNEYSNAGDGGSSSVKIGSKTYSAQGGSKGIMVYALYYGDGDYGERGRGIGQYGALEQLAASDGIACSFLNNGKKYGAGGGSGGHYGDAELEILSSYAAGETGGGEGGTGRYGLNNSTNAGKAATFYGSGGGGAAFHSMHNQSGGKGYQGIVIIKYE